MVLTTRSGEDRLTVCTEHLSAAELFGYVAAPVEGQAAAGGPAAGGTAGTTPAGTTPAAVPPAAEGATPEPA